MVAGDVPYRHGSVVTLALRALAFCFLHVRPSPRFGVKRLGAGICLRVGPCMRILKFLFPCLVVSRVVRHLKISLSKRLGSPEH